MPERDGLAEEGCSAYEVVKRSRAVVPQPQNADFFGLSRLLRQSPGTPCTPSPVPESGALCGRAVCAANQGHHPQASHINQT